MENTIKYSLLVYLIVNFTLTFWWPSYRVWKKTGIFPITFSNRDDAHDYIGKVFRLLLAALLMMGGIYVFYQPGIKYLLPIWYLDISWLKISGMCLLFIALIWISISQYQMGSSWRIGIDNQHKTALVTTGVFALSRNPIFLGMICSLMGLFLVIPNAVTLTVWICGMITISIQVRLEETFLTGWHGADYKNYCARVRRWL